MVLIPAKMGRINKRALLGRLQRIGQASRADLAKSLGLSQPTAGKIADELLRLDVLEELDEKTAAVLTGARAADTRGKVGRPGRILRLNRSRPRFLAIQLGVSETNLAAVPVGVDAEDRWTVQVTTPASAEGWVHQLKAAAAKIPQNEFWGVMVSVPGIVDEPEARVLFSPNLHWTEAVDLPKLVQQVWPSNVVLVQEERALALGHQSVDDNEEDFLLVDFGEGVGGAAIVAGKLYTSPLPLSGELGHTPVLDNLRKCGCGAVGCIETLVSVRGLLQSFSISHRGARLTWESLCRAIENNGVPRWLTETLNATAVVIAGALNVLGLRRVIITGTLTELPAAVMDHLTRAIVMGAMWARFGELEVESAPRRRTAGLVAVGIDRLVLPMETDVRMEDVASTAAVPHRALRGWLSYNE
ncbi:MAG: ROK family protein [Acidobacteriia bacterium]|nr:ROK family protein [Terriglobia bacterium]